MTPDFYARLAAAPFETCTAEMRARGAAIVRRLLDRALVLARFLDWLADEAFNEAVKACT